MDRVQAVDAEAASGVLRSRYELRSELGQGGMARVWSVRERASGRQLALKRLSAHADRLHVALFEREYYPLAGLRAQVEARVS